MWKCLYYSGLNSYKIKQIKPKIFICMIGGTCWRRLLQTEFHLFREWFKFLMLDNDVVRAAGDVFLSPLDDQRVVALLFELVADVV